MQFSLIKRLIEDNDCTLNNFCLIFANDYNACIVKIGHIQQHYSINIYYNVLKEN